MTTVLHPDFGSQLTYNQTDMDAAKHLNGNYTATLSDFVNKQLAARNMAQGVVITSMGDVPLPLQNIEYTTNGVVLRVTGNNIKLAAKKALIESSIIKWFSPVRSGSVGNQRLRYKLRGPTSSQSGVVSKLTPKTIRLQSGHKLYVVDTIVAVFE